MGRRRPDSKVRSDRKSGRREKSKKSKKKNSARYDEGDDSSHFSYLDESSVDEFDYRYGQKNKKNSEERDWTVEDDHIDDFLSDSDSSHNQKGYKERPKSRNRLHSYSEQNDSESDGSDSYRFERRGFGNGRRRRDDYDDKNSDNRSVFSARIERIRREHDDSSFSDGDSASDSHSSGSRRDSLQTSRRSSSKSSLREPTHRSLLQHQEQPTRSLGQNAAALNSSFRGQQQVQTPVTPRNIQMLMQSASNRSLGAAQSFFPGQQHLTPGGLADQAVVTQGQGQIPGNSNLRAPIGPGHLMRSLSGRSMNSCSSGQVLNRSTRCVSGQSPMEVNPSTTMGSSQSQGSKNGIYRASLRNIVPGPPMYTQQSGVMNMQTQNCQGGNQDVLLSSSMNFQQPGLMRSGSNGNLDTSDRRAELIKMASQDGLVNNNQQLNHQYAELRRASSQPSLGNNIPLNASFIQSTPYVRMDSIHQPQVRPAPTRREVTRNVSSVTGEAVVVMPDRIENISNLSTSRRSSLLSSRSRRSSPPESLADQIYSRSQRRHGDTQSQGTFYDPPGEDSSRWDGRNEELYSDDSGYDSYRDDRKSYADDPPDMFDEHRSYSDVSREESNRDKYDESFRSRGTQQDFFDDDSYVSEFKGDDVFSVSCTSRSSVRGKKSGKRTKKSPSKSILARPERSDAAATSPAHSPERVVHSEKIDIDKKNHQKKVVPAKQESSMNWLAQQISIRKSIDANTNSRNLEPEGTSTFEQKSFPSKDIRAPDAEGYSIGEPVRRRKLEPDEQSTLSSQTEYILKQKVRDPVLHSVKDGILVPDDSTNTTDTMTREVPSVIVSVESDGQDLFSDSVSFLSTPLDESNRKERRSTLEASRKKIHTDSLKRARRREKEVRSRRDPRPKKDIPREKTKSSRKKPDNGEKLMKADGVRNRTSLPHEIKESEYSTHIVHLKSNEVENSSDSRALRRGEDARSSRVSGTRKSEKTRSNSISIQAYVETESPQDQSVMDLIGQLKSLERQAIEN